MKALLICALSLAASADFVKLSDAPALSDGWVATGQRAQVERIRVKVSLKEPRDALNQQTEAVYAGKQYSHEHIMSITKPHPEALTTVLRWLRAENVDYKVSENSRVVDMELSIDAAEKLFNTQIIEVADTKRRDTYPKYHRALSIHLPSEVVPHVQTVYGLYGLPLRPRNSTPEQIAKKRARNAKAAQAWTVSPSVIWNHYQVPQERSSGNPAIRQAVAEFQGQFANQADLTQFFKSYVPIAQPGDDLVYAYKGNNGTGYGVEALLDIEYIMGVAPGMKTEFWGYYNDDFCSDLKTWTTALLATSDIPIVHSISYGYQGEPSGIGCTSAELADIDGDFQKLANQGVSIIFASGDSGSGENIYLYPSWPASSPWVTAVGATGFETSAMQREQASNEFGSGSGFSWDFPAPSYQARAVGAYLQATASTLPFSWLWKSTGRATADVSALGENFNVIVGGQDMIVGGTSASTPTFSAIVSRLNDKLTQAGKKPLGFLNAWLYQTAATMPGAFNDVTVGSDKISRDGTSYYEGFDCAPKWDPPTGHGTPVFPQLLIAAMNATRF